MKAITVGSKVKYRGCFNAGPLETVTVTRIELSKYKRCKYGNQVNTISFEGKEYGCFDLSNGHWCYGEQIHEVL